MLSALSTAYLFLGGTGAGALFVACVLDVAWAREPFGAEAASVFSCASAQQRALALTFACGLASLVAGCACLLLDLGRMDRALALVLHPSPSFVSFGAFALAALMALAVFLAVVRVLYLPIASRALVVLVEAAAAVLSCAVMLYTGLLLSSMKAVGAWDTPLVVCLFVLSSLSCGIAVALICGFADGWSSRVFAMPRGLLVADAVIIVCELVAAVLYSAVVPSAVSFDGLVAGNGVLVALWWLGFTACGLVAPAVLELVSGRAILSGRGPRAFVFIAVAAVLVLTGGACLRFCIANAGGHDSLSLAAPMSQPVDLGNTEGGWTL